MVLVHTIFEPGEIQLVGDGDVNGAETANRSTLCVSFRVVLDHIMAGRHPLRRSVVKSFMRTKVPCVTYFLSCVVPCVVKSFSATDGAACLLPLRRSLRLNFRADQSVSSALHYISRAQEFVLPRTVASVEQVLGGDGGTQQTRSYT